MGFNPRIPPAREPVLIDGAFTTGWRNYLQALGVTSGTGASGVSSLNTVTGAVTIQGVGDINVVASGQVITIEDTGSGAPVFPPEPANYVFAGPSSGSPQLPAFRPLTLADLPGAGATSWLPMTDGAEPPGFITDGAGHLITVSYQP